MEEHVDVRFASCLRLSASPVCLISFEAAARDNQR